MTDCCTDTEGGAEVLERIQANTDCFINYMGHGGSCEWTLKILDKNSEYEIERIKSTNVPEMTFLSPHIISWACNTANIGSTGCLGSCFIKKGAVSFWGACAVTFGDENRRMASEFWKSYIAPQCPQHLGEIYLEIYKKFFDNTKGCKRYMLLGDPTLKIR